MRRRKNLNINSKKIETEEGEKSILADAGLVLAFLTGFGYLIAFSYKKGFKSYYGLNEMFLSDIKIVDILIAMTSFSSLIILVYSLLQVFSEIKNQDSENPVVVAFNYKLAPTALLLLLLMFAFSRDSIMLIILGIILLLVILWIFLINPYLFIRDENGYKNKMQKYVGNVNKISYIEKIKMVYQWNKPAFIVGILMLMFCTSSFSSLYGRNQANIENEYIVVSHKHNDYVVIDNQDGNYILAPVNIKKATIRSEFIIIEGKSEFSKQIVFKHYNFKKGLKVE